MKLLPKLLAATSIFAATAAIAGPPVTVPAVTIVAPVLAILYNCTPGKMPQF